MRKYASITTILFVFLLHIHYLSWLIVQWQISLNLTYPAIVILNSVLFFYLKFRKRTIGIYPSLNKEAIFFLFFGSTLWFFSLLNNSYIWLAGISLPLMIHGALSLCIGNSAVKSYIFPIYILLLLNPIHQLVRPYANPLLKEAITKGAGSLVNLLGISIFRNGFVLQTQNYSLEIINSCSGLEGLTVSLLFGAIIAYITQKNLVPKILLFFSIVLFAFLANMVRIAGMICVGTILSSGAATKFFHGPSWLAVHLFIYPLLLFESLLLRRIWSDGNTQ